MSRSPLAPFDRWPDEFARRYRVLGYWQEESLDAFLRARVARFADRIAVVGASARDPRSWHRLTYRELDLVVDTMADRLAERGVEPGDRVVVQLPNTMELVAALFGASRLGAIPVLALPAHRQREIAQLCEAADAAAHVIVGQGWGDHRDVARLVADELAQRGLQPPAVVDIGTGPPPLSRPWPATSVSATDLALLQLSGGTTAAPKLIPRTHADYLYSARASATICGVTSDTVLLVVLPAVHNFPLSSPGILGVLDRGGRVVLAPEPSPRTAFRLIAAERVTTTSLVPPLLHAWLASPARTVHDLSSLEVVQVGGARLSQAIAARVRPELDAQLQQVFGMAEGLVNYTRLHEPDELVTTTQGRPISPHDELRVVDERDRDVPDGDVGNLLTRGPYTIRGYYPAGPHDREAFTDDGFYRTGDLVRRLPSGHLQVVGRAKEQINRGGEKIAVAEVEGLLVAHPGIHDAVLLGLPDAHLGERSCAVLVVDPAHGRPPHDLAAVRAWLTDRGLAAYKLPDRVEIVERFPATGVGKTSRRDLRRLLTDRLAGG